MGTGGGVRCGSYVQHIGAEYRLTAVAKECYGADFHIT